jgi:cytochrome c553
MPALPEPSSATRSERRTAHRRGAPALRAAVAALVLQFANAAGAPAEGAEAAAAPPAAAVCAPCHGERGSSPVAAFPNLAGQHADYLLKELTDFHKGRRTNDAMAAVLVQVETGAFPALAAYFQSQPPAPARVGDPALAATGRQLFDAGDWAAGIPPCRSCHLADGAGSGRYPRLAGQNADYTLQQLKRFKDGTRRNDPRRMMREIAARLTMAQMQALAAYLAGL